MNKYNTVLTIAGSDPSGGAGIQADLKTITALQCYGMAVITNITVQNTQGVEAIEALSSKIVSQQLEAILSDIRVDVIKIGMLGNTDIMLSIFNILKKHPTIPVVLDPILKSSSDFAFYNNADIDLLKNNLIAVSTIITPNIMEAESLSAKKIKNITDMKKIAKALCTKNLQVVLITGGHLAGDEAIDILYVKKQDLFFEFTNKKIKTNNLHGTGCTLSTAIACYLSKGNNIEKSVELAKEYVFEAIVKGGNYQLGKGNGPLCHF